MNCPKCDTETKTVWMVNNSFEYCPKCKEDIVNIINVEKHFVLKDNAYAWFFRSFNKAVNREDMFVLTGDRGFSFANYAWIKHLNTESLICISKSDFETYFEEA